MVKLSAKKIARKLSPEILQKIENQEMTEVEIVDVCIDATFGKDWFFICRGEIEQGIVTHHGAKCLDMKNFAIKVDALANYAVPCDRNQFDELRIQFANAICKGSSDETKKDMTLTFPDDETVKAGFDRACNELHTKIIRKCHGGKKKAFQKRCKKTTLEDFRPFLRNLYENALENHPFKKIVNSLHAIRKIADQMHHGDHKVTQNCWECDNVVDCPNWCSKCMGAFYCGEACQRKAWKKGHRYSCPYVREVCENYKKNQAVVKEAQANPDEHERRYGFRPNSQIDTFVMRAPFLCFSAIDGDDVHMKLTSTSMECFYSNLDHVKNGLLWSDRPGAVPNVESAALLDFSDLSCWYRPAFALALQYPELGHDGTIEAFDHRNSEFHSKSSTVELFEEDFIPSSNCTAAEFLKTYASWEHGRSYDRIYRELADSYAEERIREYDRMVVAQLVKERRARTPVKKSKAPGELPDKVDELTINDNKNQVALPSLEDQDQPIGQGDDTDTQRKYREGEVHYMN